MTIENKPGLALVTPLLLNEAAAAAALDESPQTRRIRRYEDQKRLDRGEAIEGPPWLQDGKRIKYRWIDLQAYAAALTPPIQDAGGQS